MVLFLFPESLIFDVSCNDTVDRIVVDIVVIIVLGIVVGDVVDIVVGIAVGVVVDIVLYIVVGIVVDIVLGTVVGVVVDIVVGIVLDIVVGIVLGIVLDIVVGIVLGKVVGVVVDIVVGIIVGIVVAVVSGIIMHLFLVQLKILFIISNDFSLRYNWILLFKESNAPDIFIPFKSSFSINNLFKPVQLFKRLAIDFKLLLANEFKSNSVNELQFANVIC